MLYWCVPLTVRLQRALQHVVHNSALSIKLLIAVRSWCNPPWAPICCAAVSAGWQWGINKCTKQKTVKWFTTIPSADIATRRAAAACRRSEELVCVWKFIIYNQRTDSKKLMNEFVYLHSLSYSRYYIVAVDKIISWCCNKELKLELFVISHRRSHRCLNPLGGVLTTKYAI